MPILQYFAKQSLGIKGASRQIESDEIKRITEQLDLRMWNEKLLIQRIRKYKKVYSA